MKQMGLFVLWQCFYQRIFSGSDLKKSGMTLCTAVGPLEDSQQLVGTVQRQILRKLNSLELHLCGSTALNIFHHGNSSPIGESRFMLQMLYLWKHLSTQGLQIVFQLLCNLSLDVAVLNTICWQINQNIKKKKVEEEGVFFSLPWYLGSRRKS